MLGFGHIGQFAIGFIQDGFPVPLVYDPVSRILAGGFANTRPAAVAVLGSDLIDDEGNFIVSDDDYEIGTEA